jgi:hypothetical protein
MNASSCLKFDKMKKIITAFLFYWTFQMYSQTKPTIYLIFEEGAQSTCDYNPPKKDSKTIQLNYVQKRYRKVGVTWFFMCKQQFVFEFKTDFFKVITEDEVQKIKTMTVQELMDFRNQHPPTENPQDLVEKIFLIEAIESNQYAIYGVFWKDQDR